MKDFFVPPDLTKQGIAIVSGRAKQGLLISEYEPGIKPQKVYFPRRNRIIVAFSDEIFITSAGKGSGALITAQYGEKYHRKIWIITNDRKSSV